MRRLMGFVSTRRGLLVVLAAILAIAAIVAFTVIFGRDPSTTPPSDSLSRVPGALRAGCWVETGSPWPGAVRSLSCHDTTGQDAVIGLFTDKRAVDDAYEQAVRDSGSTQGSGDCTAGTGGEHRWPSTGAAKGRVLCYSRYGTAAVIWTDDEARTVARAESPAADEPAQRQAWMSWTPTPAFPTAEERSLIEVLAGTDCRRAGIADLDDFPGAVTGVECSPQGAGARTASYFRFASLAALRAAADDHATAFKAPAAVWCGDGKAAGFLGTHVHDLRSVELGVLLCHPGSQSTLVMEWSTEPLLVMGRAVGTNPDDLAAWWRNYSGPPASKITEAVNAQATPPFPSEQEKALLTHVPAASRVNCMRPSNEQIRKNVAAAPVVAVVCGPTSGVRIVFYYQFADQAAMRESYKRYGGDPISEPACTTLPTGFSGESAYSRGGATGRMQCRTNEGNNRYLIWTDDRLAIEVFAFQGFEPAAMIEWWRHEAGPV